MMIQQMRLARANAATRREASREDATRSTADLPRVLRYHETGLDPCKCVLYRSTSMYERASVYDLTQERSGDHTAHDLSR
eukprot:2783773-Alexandrium_andersonii.AAC.1